MIDIDLFNRAVTDLLAIREWEMESSERNDVIESVETAIIVLYKMARTLGYSLVHYKYRIINDWELSEFTIVFNLGSVSLESVELCVFTQVTN